MNKLKLFCTFLLVCIMGCLFYSLYRSTLPTLDAYGQLQIRQFASAVVIHQRRIIFDPENKENFIIVKRNSQGEIEQIDYDVLSVNRLVDDLVSLTEATIKEVQEGNYYAKDDSRYEKYLASVSTKEGIKTTIPLESLISFPPISFLHWRLNMRYQVESNVVGRVNQIVESYGINNTYVKIEVTITMYQKMLLPFFDDLKDITITFPIAMAIIPGQVPNTYIGGNNNG